MADTTQRILRLLAVLTSRPVWTGPELAARLEVTERTLRRDVARLRGLGYRIDSVQGVCGGYHLAGGRLLPPLVLDDDEAVALVACLRMAVLDSGEMGEAALRAVAKLDRVLPPQVRAAAGAVDAAVLQLPARGPGIDWRMLLGLAKAQRETRWVRFDYSKSDGIVESRKVEPAHLFTRGGRWYLVGWDRLREDWRTFRLDRMSAVAPTDFTFTPRPVPAALRQQHLETATDNCSDWPCNARFWLGASREAIARRIPGRHFTMVEEGADGCVLDVGGSDWGEVAWHMVWVSRDLGADLRIVEGEQVRDALEALATEFQSVARRVVSAPSATLENP